jgi:membrane-associated phospholipid phosphatase
LSLAVAVPAAAGAGDALTTAGATSTTSGIAGRSLETTSLDTFVVDDNRKLHRYAANLGQNLKGVVASGNSRVLLLGLGLAAGSSLLDDNAVRYFDRNPYQGAARTGATMGQGLVVAGVTAGLFGAGLVVPSERFRDTTYDLSQAVLVNGVYTYALKHALRRVRPDGSDRLSFPSGHTSTQFAIATVLQAHYGKKVGVPAYAVASFVGASRMASKKHHLSDVVAGATLGYVVGRTVVGGHGGDRRRLLIAPAASPSGDGVGLAVSLGF